MSLKMSWDGEMAQPLEDPSLIPSTHMVFHNFPESHSVPGDLTTSSDYHGHCACGTHT